MNRKSFLKSLVAMVALPFVAKGVTTVEVLPKAVQKQTKIEEQTIKKFYTETRATSGVFANTSGIRFMCSGIAPDGYR